MKKIKIGRITGAQGLRGEVKMYHDSGEEEALSRLTSLFLGSSPGTAPESEPELEAAEYIIENMRMQKRTPIFKLKGITDRDSAEALVGSDVFTDEEESRPEGESAWFASDLVGMRVRAAGLLHSARNDEDKARGDEDKARGDEECRVKSIISNPAHDILEIETPYGVKMIPFVDAFIQEVDTKTGCITIIPPEGWLD